MSLPRINPNDQIRLSGQDAIQMIERVAAKLQSRTKKQHANTEQSVTDMLHRELASFRVDAQRDYTEDQIEWMREQLINGGAGGYLGHPNPPAYWEAEQIIEEFHSKYPDCKVPTF